MALSSREGRCSVCVSAGGSFAAKSEFRMKESVCVKLYGYVRVIEC